MTLREQIEALVAFVEAFDTLDRTATWSALGRPEVGPLHDARRALPNDVRRALLAASPEPTVSEPAATVPRETARDYARLNELRGALVRLAAAVGDWHDTTVVKARASDIRTVILAAARPDGQATTDYSAGYHAGFGDGQRAAHPDPEPAAGLDAAWREAEAALPNGWQMSSLVAAVKVTNGVKETVSWRMTAYSSYGPPQTEASGPTPAGALTALPAALRDRP